MLASRCRRLALAALLFLGLPGRSSWLAPAAGQTPAAASPKRPLQITAEQLPELPTGGDIMALITAVEQRITLPPGTPVTTGQVSVKFAVSATGLVEHPEISIGMSPIVDKAVLEAVRRLPTLRPGTRNGQPVRMAVFLNVRPPAPPASPQERREAQTRRQGLAERQPGEADTTFLRRVLPVSFSKSGQALAATWRPSAYGKQLFFSVPNPADNDYGTDLFMLDPFQPTTYAVQVFSIPSQGDQTYLQAFFFADVNQDGQKEMLAIGECSLREDQDGRVAHYQTSVFQCTGPDNTGHPRYQAYSQDTSYLDELATAAAVRQALAQHQLHRRLASPASKAPKK